MYILTIWSHHHLPSVCWFCNFALIVAVVPIGENRIHFLNFQLKWSLQLWKIFAENKTNDNSWALNRASMEYGDDNFVRMAWQTSIAMMEDNKFYTGQFCTIFLDWCIQFGPLKTVKVPILIVWLHWMISARFHQTDFIIYFCWIPDFSFDIIVINLRFFAYVHVHIVMFMLARPFHLYGSRKAEYIKFAHFHYSFLTWRQTKRPL